jgi:hypothetical protein
MAEKENPDDLCISPTHFENLIAEVPKELRETNLLYMFRIYASYSDKYVFKVGYTDDLLKRVKGIDSEFKCLGRIIVVMVCKVESMKVERQCHKELKDKRADITNNHGSKKKECYVILPSTYDVVKEFMEKHELKDTAMFDSKTYVLDGDDTDEWTEDWNGDVLSRDDDEEKLWHQYISDEAE